MINYEEWEGSTERLRRSRALEHWQLVCMLAVSRRMERVHIIIENDLWFTDDARQKIKWFLIERKMFSAVNYEQSQITKRWEGKICTWMSSVSFICSFYLWWICGNGLKNNNSWKINCQLSDIDLNESFDFGKRINRHTNVECHRVKCLHNEKDETKKNKIIITNTNGNAIANDVVEHVATKRLQQ